MGRLGARRRAMSAHQRRQHDRRLMRRLLGALVIVLVILVILDRTADDGEDQVEAAPSPVTRSTSTTTGSFAGATSSTLGIGTSSPLGGLTSPPISDLFDIRSCTGEAVYDVIGIDRFRAAGATVEEVALGPTLEAVGIHVTETDLTALAARFEPCRTIKILAEGHVRGLRVPIDTALVTCVGDATHAQPASGRAAAELLGGTATAPYAVAMSAGLQRCPDTVVSLMLTVLETERSLSSSQRSCVRRETLERLVPLSDAIAELDDHMGRFFFQVGSACP